MVTNMKLEYIQVGRIVNAHGTRGELRVQPIRVDAPFLTRFKTFYVDGKPVQPTANHVHKSLILMKLPGIDDMNAALNMKGKVLSVRRDDAALDDGEYFDEELTGVEVYDADTGAMLGTVKAVEAYPAHKVYTVQGQREYLIPAVPGVFIQSLNLEENRMEVHMLEGLATDEN